MQQRVEVDAAAWRALAVVSVATFMSALDGSVVNVALPTIRVELGAPVAHMEWVVMSYLLSISALLLPFGKMGDTLGHARLMALGFVGFGAASLACGAAPGLGILVAFRGVQGIGAALLMATGPALISTRFPPQARGRALGLQATATYLGLALGPSLGGLITEHLGWRWVFWVNLPIAIPAAVVLLRGSKRSSEEHASGQTGVDLLSATLFATTIVSAILAMEQSRRNAPVALGLGAAAAVLGTAFVWRQRVSPKPLLPLDMFKSAAFSVGVGVAYLQYLVLFVSNFLVPFFLQGPGRMSPGTAGLIMTAQPLAMVALTAFAGYLSDRIGPRVPSAFGMAVLAAGAWLMSGLNPDASPWHAAAGLALLGVGAGFFTSPNNSAILGAASRERQGVASGLLAAARNVGMVSGISVAGAFLGVAGGGRGEGQSAAHPAIEHAFRDGLRVAAAIALAGFLLTLLRPAADRSR